MAKHEIIEFSGNLVKVISQSENYNNEFLYLLMKSRDFKEFFQVIQMVRRFCT